MERWEIEQQYASSRCPNGREYDDEGTTYVFRLASTRAYYSAFHRARTFLLSKQEIASDARHESIWDRFKNSGTSRSAVLRKAKALKRMREWADYDNPASPEFADCREVLDELTQFHSLFGALET